MSAPGYSKPHMAAYVEWLKEMPEPLDPAALADAIAKLTYWDQFVLATVAA